MVIALSETFVDMKSKSNFSWTGVCDIWSKCKYQEGPMKVNLLLKCLKSGY